MANKYTFEEHECRMCGCDYIGGVNIKIKKVTICDDCCNAVTKQHMIFLINEEVPRLKKCIQDQRTDYYCKPTKNAFVSRDGCGKLFERKDDVGMTECKGRTLCLDCDALVSGDEQ